MRRHHCSPDVHWPVGPVRALQALAYAWLCAGAAVLAYWWWASVQPWWVQLAAVLGWGMLALGARRWLGPSAPGAEAGVLQWQAGQWRWQPHGALQARPLLAPQVVLDLQQVLVVRWALPAPQRGYHCLWLQRADDATQWDALRRAVYSSTLLPPEGA